MTMLIAVWQRPLFVFVGTCVFFTLAPSPSSPPALEHILGSEEG